MIINKEHIEFIFFEGQIEWERKPANDKITGSFLAEKIFHSKLYFAFEDDNEKSVVILVVAKI